MARKLGKVGKKTVSEVGGNGRVHTAGGRPCVACAENHHLARTNNNINATVYHVVTPGSSTTTTDSVTYSTILTNGGGRDANADIVNTDDLTANAIALNNVLLDSAMPHVTVSSNTNRIIFNFTLTIRYVTSTSLM